MTHLFTCGAAQIGPELMDLFHGELLNRRIYPSASASCTDGVCMLQNKSTRLFSKVLQQIWLKEDNRRAAISVLHVMNQLGVVLLCLCWSKSRVCFWAEGDEWPHRWWCLSRCVSRGCGTTVSSAWLVQAAAWSASIIRWQTSTWNTHSGQPPNLSQPHQLRRRRANILKSR